MLRIRLRFVLCLALLSSTSVASATYAIVGCDAATGRCGVAIATHNLAVGHGAPFAQAGVGAGVSQFETNPCHAPAVLTSLGDGATAQSAIRLALAAEKKCADGLGHDFRQLGVVALDGDSAVFSGESANGQVGDRVGDGVAVLGNGLASASVIDAMYDTYAATRGELAERLMRALEAGLGEGGQAIGVLSAALLVRTPSGWPVDIDLRVDYSPGHAVTDLRTAYNANRARRVLFRASRSSDEDAQVLVERALQLAPTWDRIWKQAAHIALQSGHETQARRRQCQFRKLNPNWADRLGWGEHCSTESN